MAHLEVDSPFPSVPIPDVGSSSTHHTPSPDIDHEPVTKRSRLRTILIHFIVNCFLLYYLDRLTSDKLIEKVRSNQKIITRDIFNINLVLQTILMEVRNQGKLSVKDRAIKANGIF